VEAGVEAGVEGARKVRARPQQKNR